MQGFEDITPEKILSLVKNQSPGYYYSIRPTELCRTPYKYSQTIILKGQKTVYESLIIFWLSCQAWFDDDEIIFDDLTSYNGWHQEPNRVGICQLANAAQTTQYQKAIQAHFDYLTPDKFLIMSPEWNNLKVLFQDQLNYYLYYFWTGE